MAKTKDLFLNIAANPNMTLEDLASVGLTSENTMLLDRAQYASNEKVQDMFRDEEGNFDEQKFNTFYDIAEQSYNILATDETNLNLMNVTAYDSDNIFVDPSKRRQKNQPFVAKLPNPDRLNVGITRIGKIGPRTLSQDEIAQTQEVLLNPTEVAKGGKPIYGKSPNESWFDDFWDTKVMAAWDEDGTHVDPVTGKEVQHKKGDLKLNENGTYYYESLDGRSVYGKRILNKFNTLTTDGSAWNKYDFFDSDSIEQKSIGGSIAKNLALVGSMFIPYVGWGVAAASVAHQSLGLFATLGKMLAGADDPTLNAIEGWVKSTDRRNLKTEYAQQNMWCWENFIDLIGDTTAQLREQKAIFKFVPGLIKGDFKALSDKKMKEYGEKLLKESVKNVTDKSFIDIDRIAQKQNPNDWKKQLGFLMQGTNGVFSAKAEKAVRDYISSYYKLGEPIAKAYMTAITVQDTFGEAIEAGASNNEATLLTLGYAAAEAALLSTDLGKWIMPELRTERMRYKTIAKKLLELPQETREMSKQISRLSGETKKEWAKRLFNIGKDIANAEYSTMTKTVGSVLASGLGEGIEEVSEEALADFSKSCFNLVQQLQGDDVRMHAWNHNWDWSEAANRYGMSFAGGIMGGGINAAASDYKVNKDLLNMTSQQAMQQLVYMSRNNELDDFWKVVNKTTLAPKELSTTLNSDGVGYKPGTKEDNQDLAAKQALKKQVDLINSILNAENAKLDDGGLLSALIQADPSLKDLDPVKEYRMRALANSATAGRFLNEWNTVTSDIVKNRLEQQKIINKYGDESSEKYSEEDKETLKNLGKDLKILQERKDKMLDGGRTREYVRDALFEMSHAINETFNELSSEIRYAEAKTGKKYSDISEPEKQKLHETYEKIMSSNQFAEKVHELADIYETMAATASDGIKASADFYEEIRKGGYQNITDLTTTVKKRLGLLQRLTKDSEQGVSKIQDILNSNYQDDLLIFAQDQNLVDQVQQLGINAQAEVDRIVAGRTLDQLTDAEKNQINNASIDLSVKTQDLIANSVFNQITDLQDEFIKAGFIHPETKEALTQMVGFVKNSLSGQMEAAEWNSALGDPDVFNAKWELIDNKLKEIDKLSNTPIIENLSKFQLSTNTDRTTLDLLSYLLNKEQESKKDISSFQLDSTTLEQFKDARDLLTMYRAAIVGARYDNVDLDNIVGFNTTLNEISGEKETSQLAEIDAVTADLILEDIDFLLKRLDYAEGLHKLNTGNKYNVQSKTALNKQFITHNKLKHFISIIEDDDDWKDVNGTTYLADLKQAIADAATLNANAGTGNYDSRKFTLSLDEKAKIEEESIKTQTALHNFLKAHIDGSKTSIDKLAKILTYENFKGLIRENTDILEASSEDIDDSAFVWWLCATAALDPHQFYNNYRATLGEETEGEKPIAPIPTQELGDFVLTAAIVNGDMFNHFGKALRQSLFNFWDNADEATRQQIRDEYGQDIFWEDAKKPYFKNSDFLPNFDNIVFVEGIAGSGKSTGVLKTLSKILAKSNPDFVNQKIMVAHTNKTKAEKLGNSTKFTNLEEHDHDSLLSYITSEYTHIPKNDKGEYVYVMDKDVVMVDGVLRSKWALNQYNPVDVPKLWVIDEWSHYNQVEQELIQRFAQTYGVQVVAMGDYDQLTPSASIVDEHGTTLMTVDPSRNMTPRVAKLGVSMRTDNEVKNTNMYNLLAWRRNPKAMVDLHYYEDDSGIYGDKNYRVGSQYDANSLNSIKADIQKMIDTLKEGEKIGYIYHDENSDLYKWITSTAGIKEHIQSYTEKDAHGEEAQYYIVETNRSGNQDALSYFQSINTGITRSEQGSIVITAQDIVKDPSTNNKVNRVGLSFKTVQDSEMLPNTYTDEGTRQFTRQRKDVFDGIFGDEEVTAFDIKPRTAEPVVMVSNQPNNLNINGAGQTAPTPNPTQTTGSSTTSTQQTQTQQQTTQQQTTQPTPTPNPQTQNDTTQDTADTTEEPANIPVPNDAQPDLSLEEFGGTRTPDDYDPSELFAEDDSWTGQIPKNTRLYNAQGVLFGTVSQQSQNNGEAGYLIRDVIERDIFMSESDIMDNFYFNVPATQPRVKVGDKFNIHNDSRVLTITDVHLAGDKQKPTWEYSTDYDNSIYKTFDDDRMDFYLTSRALTPADDVNSESTPDTTVLEVEGQSAYEEMVEEMEAQQAPPAVYLNGEDIGFNLLGFTFNNEYLADEFDKDGKIVIKLRDRNRIDNGYGLIKLNRTLNDKAKLKEFIGRLRKHVEFSKNADIVQEVQKITGQTGLTMRWAFVSKTDSNYDDKYSRMNASRAQLEYMHKDDSDVPTKTLSAVIYQNGVAVLELPIITLQSPHSIFRELRDKNLGKDILSFWSFDKKSKGETIQRLTNIVRYIQKTYPNHQGYQDLCSQIKLWLFTSNGFKRLPQNFNLHNDCTNLGNIYVVSRYSDSIEEHDYIGQWQPLDEHARSDRFISSIMMNNKETHIENGKIVNIFRPHVPYVFISDDPKITNDTQAARQYLRQQADPSVEKTVKVVPVSPPEVSVRTYIEAMHKLISGKSTNEPYGNKYSAYRILEAIVDSDEATTILGTLSDENRAFIKTYINKLKEIKVQNPIGEKESKIAYRRRLALAQNTVLDEVIDGYTVAEKLRALLVKTSFYQQFGTDEEGNTNILTAIEAVCKKAGITGVLAKPHYNKNQTQGIGGFAYTVQVEDGYNYPGQGPFRIFAKVDPPTYNLNSLKGFINQLAKEAQLGITDKYGVYHDNIWWFEQDEASSYFLPDTPVTTFNLQQVLQKCQILLDRLGLNDYNIDTSQLQGSTSNSDAIHKAVELINKEYLKQLGAFVIQDGGKYRYGNIITDQTPEFKNYKFDGVETTSTSMQLRFIDLSTNQPVLVECEIDRANNQFKIKPLDKQEQSNSLVIADVKAEIRNAFAKIPFLQAYQSLGDNILNLYDETNNTVDIPAIEQLLADSGINSLLLQGLKRTLKLDALSSEQQQDLCVNPIKIKFK